MGDESWDRLRGRRGGEGGYVGGEHDEGPLSEEEGVEG